ncbi:MAG: DUF4126 domain-containing protein [Gammaproteobacteria bacterium]
MYDQVVTTLALTMGVAWASGINLYATIAVVGALGRMGEINLPPDLEVLENEIVIAAAALMYFVEFFMDKVPGVDTGWDTIHTFIRIPAGAMLAAGAVGDLSPAVQVAAGILGAGAATSSHATKAGSRVLINTSPEPFSNWTASVAEDLAVFGGLWAALHHPWLFLGLFVAWVLLLIWLLPKVWRGIRKVFRWLARLLGAKDEPSLATPSDQPSLSFSGMATPKPDETGGDSPNKPQ